MIPPNHNNTVTLRTSDPTVLLIDIPVKMELGTRRFSHQNDDPLHTTIKSNGIVDAMISTSQLLG